MMTNFIMKTRSLYSFSQSSIAGEGEHKIFAEIRARPNERSCIYGMDADIIMIALTTHRDNHFVLREKKTPGYIDLQEWIKPKSYSIIYLSKYVSVVFCFCNLLLTFC
jgi:hypothetical protein